MFISPFRGSTIEFEWEKITLEERTLRDRTACLIPRVLIEGARSKSSCPSYFLLRLFTCIEGSILGRSNEQRTRRWRATLSEGCAALPAEGWHHRVCPLKRWKHVDRGWWPFFRSADPVLPTVKISAWTKAFSRVYTPRTRPVLLHSRSAGSGVSRWQDTTTCGGARQTAYSISAPDIKRAIWKLANARHASSGRQNLIRPIVERPERSFCDLRGGVGRLRTSLTRYVDRSIVTRAIGQCADCVFFV